MFIRVCNSQVMWGDPNRLVWLTINDPDPYEVDLEDSSLPIDTVKAIQDGLKFGKLYQTDQYGKGIQIPKQNISPFSGKQDLLTNKLSIEERVELSEAGIDIELFNKVKDLLKKSLNTLRKEISQMTDIRIIKTCIDLEKKKSNRKKVLKLLEDQISKATNLNTVTDVNFYESIIEEEIEEVMLDQSAFSNKGSEINGSTPNSRDIPK